MDRITELTLDFFDSRKRNFWHWADNGEVLELRTGETLCYKADLLDILRGLSGVPVPYLGAVILGITACSDNWQNKANIRNVLHTQILKNNHSSIPELNMRLHNAFETLNVIHGVVKELRSESMRIHLLRAIFEDLAPELTAVNDIEPVVDRFKGLLAQEGSEVFCISFQKNLLLELAAFENSKWRKKGSTALEHYLLTNLADTPKPADIAPLPEPETEPLTLIDELLQDDKTEGLARLTQRLRAAIHIPAKTKGASDQPFGGFSDITNRGNFDRLLLSELAQDDDTLTARLVNNEAMYLRREEPPSDVERERTILVDTTIQMWGYPRVFALAAALACAEKKQHISRINAFALRGTDCEVLDLTTKKGVIEALGQLDAHLHCGVALRDFLSNVRHSTTHDIVFVTDAETFKTADFSLFFAESKRLLTYLIIVNRVGDLQVFDLSGGRSKSLGTSKFDLKSLLFPPKKRENTKPTTSLFNPSYYSLNPLPLYYLPTGATLNRMHILSHPSVGVVNITQDKRVLRWTTPERGALELLPFIEEGEYCMGFGNISMLYIMVSNEATRLFKFYKIDIRNSFVESHDLTGKAFATVDEMAYQSSGFYLQTEKMLDCREAEIIGNVHGFEEVFAYYTKEKQAISLKHIKQIIKNRNSPLQHPTAIFINIHGELTINRFSLQEQNSNIIFREVNRLRHDVDADKEELLRVSTPFENPFILFYEKKWQDGSIAAIDSRGLLHLKSSNESIPQITIVLTLGGMSAAWSSDGRCCGNAYFLTATVRYLSTSNFYQHYIKRFIHHILNA